mgnify:CR=1 FL=1
MTNRSRLTSVTLGVALGVTVGVTLLASCAAAAPATVGVARTTGKLAPCPEGSRNCVNTQAAAGDTQHAIAPLTFTGTADVAKAKLRQVIESMPRTKIVSDEGNYLHAEFTSLIFRFVDDVEFVIDAGAQRIDFRSSSRVGQGDMGVNRNRMEEIRTKFNQ